MYKILKMEGRAKRAHMETVHGNIETPVFMNVGTAAAIKGAVSTEDLQQIGTQVELSNTYHLHVRPGDEVVKKMGGLHKFMVWDKPILTDSGGFQVFSLAGLRKIKEEGVYFHSHVDGRKIFMGPEESMQIQSNLASTIAMAFDECPSSVADRRYVQNSVDRTARWLQRCKDKMRELNQREDTINKHQLLFGINQGAIYEDIRIDHAKRISEMDLDGYARDFPRQGIIRRTGTGCRFEFRRCGDSHRYFTPVRRVGNRVVFGTGCEQRCTHCDSQNGFEKSFHSRRMCLLVFSVIGVINAAACFAGSAIVQDSAVGKTFLDRDAEDLNRRSGVRSSLPLNRRFVVFFHNHRGIMFESFYIVSWLWATTNIDNIQLRNKKESKIHRIFIFRCGLCVKASEI